MRKILMAVLVLLLCIPFACKKDKGDSQQLLLSKIFEDGFLTREYLYDSDNRPYRLNVSYVSNGQSQPGGYRLYSYNDDDLLEYVSYYNAQNQFSYRYRLNYDANNRNVRMDFLSGNNNLLSYYLLEYDTDNKLIQHEIRNGGTNQIMGEGYYTYNQAGALVKIIRNSFLGGNTVPFDSTTFVPGSIQLPAHWNYFESLMHVALPNGEPGLFEMFIDYSDFYRADAPPQILRKTLTGRTYNASGYLTRQQLEIESIYFDAENFVQDMTYEYISLN